MKFWFTYPLVNYFVIAGSALLCFLLTPTRLPGMELLGIGVNWILIWVVVWSLKRTIFQGVMAGLVMGLIQDGLTGAYPSHVFSLVLVGLVTARLQKQRYIQEDFISVALIVFGMVILSETMMAAQYIVRGIRPLNAIWTDYQRLVLSSAILSSLWAPVLYYPLNHWWEKAPRKV
ncbi:rod shape-determining protein MreD [Aphanothece sacrum]|uniref:Rod shape-determining protein MreD n=1 Tax=Aphanothece sacrum FPU1 TaxID=1920663 RepID=A0A401IIT8_APHSA|nr:rod shape-determining protein MreD [Aphanothece sacrum]GBF81208.1 rod shape-determining protein MreD [Aphanothece sacrum FPU1]GBF83443.1 rod shape-determining protein MreD [Aphanothece sacrum FPU3]